LDSFSLDPIHSAEILSKLIQFFPSYQNDFLIPLLNFESPNVQIILDLLHWLTFLPDTIQQNEQIIECAARRFIHLSQFLPEIQECNHYSPVISFLSSIFYPLDDFLGYPSLLELIKAHFQHSQYSENKLIQWRKEPQTFFLENWKIQAEDEDSSGSFTTFREQTFLFLSQPCLQSYVLKFIENNFSSTVTRTIIYSFLSCTYFPLQNISSPLDFNSDSSLQNSEIFSFYWYVQYFVISDQDFSLLDLQKCHLSYLDEFPFLFFTLKILNEISDHQNSDFFLIILLESFSFFPQFDISYFPDFFSFLHSFLTKCAHQFNLDHLSKFLNISFSFFAIFHENIDNLTFQKYFLLIEEILASEKQYAVPILSFFFENFQANSEIFSSHFYPFYFRLFGQLLFGFCVDINLPSIHFDFSHLQDVEDLQIQDILLFLSYFAIKRDFETVKILLVAGWKIQEEVDFSYFSSLILSLCISNEFNLVNQICSSLINPSIGIDNIVIGFAAFLILNPDQIDNILSILEMDLFQFVQQLIFILQTHNIQPFDSLVLIRELIPFVNIFPELKTDDVFSQINKISLLKFLDDIASNQFQMSLYSHGFYHWGCIADLVWNLISHDSFLQEFINHNQ
jgi:hypothetical protein